MGTLTDEDLRHLLGEAAASFALPEGGADDVLEEAEEVPVPLVRRRWVQVPAAAAVVAGALLAGAVLAGGGPGSDRGGFVGVLGGTGTAERAAEGDTATGESATGESATGDAGDAYTAAGGGAADELRRTSGGPESAQKSARLDDTAGRATALSGSAPQAATAAGAKAGAPQGAPVPAAPEPDGARVVKTGAIALVVEDDQVTPVLTQVQALATSAGGVVAGARTEELGPTPSGSVTLRVPVDSFEEVVAAVRGLDADVRSATTSGRDVTAQYADLEAQLRTLKAARERFLEILSRARSIGDVLAVQQRVDDVTGKIDRLEGQRRLLASQSEQATLEVTVTEADDPVVTKKNPDDGLSKAFADAWHGFTSGVEGLIRISGRGVLLLMCLAAAYAVARLGWRASRRRLV